MLLAMEKNKINRRNFEKMLNTLKNGRIVVLPTDSMYALCCSIFEKKALNKLYKIKKVDKTKPMSIICSDIKMASEYAIISNRAFKVLRKVTPGPYTFILNANRIVPKIMLTRRHTIGVRIPDNRLCTSLAKELGCPLISTSISSLFNEEVLDPYEIDKKLGKEIDLTVDVGRLPAYETTIIDFTLEEPEIIREGIGKIDFL